MIKINLLGVAAPTPAKGPAAPATAIFQAGTFIIALVTCFLVVGIFYKIWHGAVVDLQTELEKQKREQQRLAAIKAENERYEQQRRQLEQRINTIQALQAKRTGPVDMMTTLGSVVNKTSDLYFLGVTPAGDRLSIRGQSNSVDSVKNFMSILDSLKQAGVEDVQLRSFYQDDQQGRLSYKFALDFQYKPPAVTAAQQASAPGGPATPGQKTGL